MNTTIDTLQGIIKRRRSNEEQLVKQSNILTTQICEMQEQQNRILDQAQVETDKLAATLALEAIERGDCNMTLWDLVKYCNALDVKITFLPRSVCVDDEP